ncbi:hypothetical protein GH714_004862 [Hevea brasiliensis]|uniref:AAA+ ATPase domain-containing protein n=1 Tax=Hevea brasiliensis TaxID=3981 RepID=A0A6A6LD05_HEVBR|nr:hypothetical protein GH714_004862 [Hevea brasiliensis]
MEAIMDKVMMKRSEVGHHATKMTKLVNEPIRMELRLDKTCQVANHAKTSLGFWSKQTRALLTNAAYVHLKHADVSKYTRNLAPASRAILLSGPAELYQQMLAKALSHYFETKLLLLDVTSFSLKIQGKYGSTMKESSFKRSTSESTLERLSGFFRSLPFHLRRKNQKVWMYKDLLRASKGGLRRQYSGVDILQGFGYVSKASPIVLYLRDVDKFLSRSQRIYNLFQKMLKKLSGSVLILGSQIVDLGNDNRELDERLLDLFPYNIEIRPPKDENHLIQWFSATIEEIVVSAISYHLMNSKDPEYRNGKLIISSKSLSHGLSIFQEGKSVDKDTLKLEAQAEMSKESGGVEIIGVKPETKVDTVKPENITEAEKPDPGVKTDGDNSLPASKVLEVPPDNEFEKRIRPEVIPANEINVAFSDIGALEETKESLQELVMLPLRRPDLFKGGLLKPCRGILLFGPPGTGKTMLAKAIAKEAGASFINVSMSTITSKWFGEDEKNVRALFTLAAKVSPTIIFVDEVDSMLGQRTRVGEHEAMRKIKNEFMTHWDGLMTKQGERILVLAATNRPFDLDEAIIRRFERRIMVGLPSPENREMIFRTLLSKEKVEGGLDFKELATMTEGFTGSDLKNLCTTAAYRPVRELIRQERLKDMEKKQRAAEAQKLGQTAAAKEDNKEDRVITLRPLNMEDFRQAKNQVAASFAAEGSIMSELKQWNDSYGEGVREKSSSCLISYDIGVGDRTHIHASSICIFWG